jgi:hypothetical protein
VSSSGPGGTCSSLVAADITKMGDNNGGEIFKSGWAPSLIVHSAPPGMGSRIDITRNRALSNVNWPGP